jgi:hypothetical protein
MRVVCSMLLISYELVESDILKVYLDYMNVRRTLYTQKVLVHVTLVVQN